MKEFINQNGVRIVVIEDNYKDQSGNKYTTWRFSDTDRTYCVSKENFKAMIKANKYKEVK